MSFDARPYPDIARDLLTTLTGGTVRESVLVPAGDDAIVLETLANRPIRRISHMQGVIDLGPDADPSELPYRFTSADYELIATDGGADFDAVRFRPEGRRPAAGSTLVVNYYPIDIPPPPLTDLNVGSVVRTLMESFAAELALEEQFLDRVYRSAFLETAEGSSLDKVVALVGVKRIPAGVPVTKVRFSRSSSAVGRIVVPAGAVISDLTGETRYATLLPLTLEPGEAAREVNAAAQTPGAPPVEANSLTRLEVLVAGVGAVVNPAAAVTAAAPETDEALRRRARGALHVAARGTLDALEYGIKALDGVKDVSVTEFPNGVPGEVRLDVVYGRDGDPDVERAVAARIKALRPAGIRVLSGAAARTQVQVTVALTLAGSGLSAPEVTAVQGEVEGRLATVLDRIPPGGVARQAQMLTAVLSDPRIVDASVSLSADGGAPADRLQLADGVALSLVRPFIFPPVAIEQAGAAGGGTPVEVDLALPVTLNAGITTADAESAIRLAAESHLAQVARQGGVLSFDQIAAAIRDDTRFALNRAAASATVETDGRFVQLTDGLGSFSETGDRVLRLRTLTVAVEEGGG